MPGALPRRPIHVALLGERADFYGGGQRSLLDLARGLLTRRGIEPCVILPGEGPLAAALAAAGVATRSLALPPLRRPLAASGALRRLRRLLVSERFDLLHTNGPRSAFYGGIAARLAGVPHLFHLRASRPARLLSDRLLLALCDRAVAVSRAAARRSGAARACPRIRVIETGIAPPPLLERGFARAVLGLPGGAPIAVVVGRVEADKGGGTAVRALPSLRRSVPGTLLAFLGESGPGTAARQSLRLGAAAAGVSEAVLFLGPRDDAAALYGAFDLILHPSRHEALPRVLIEALHTGLPVVAAAVGGIPEVIDPERTGLLVPPDDPEALAAAAARLLLDPVLRGRLARDGAVAARTRFGLPLMIGRIAALYDEMIPGRAPRTAPREVLP